ncbi:4'-phosphopantetheinyl transferase family protein [Gallibacterium sp. ZY190522]
MPSISYVNTIFQRTTLLVDKKKQRKVGYFLLWKLLQQLGQESIFFQGIEKDQQGRPYLKAQQFDFNISHSGDWVAMILRKREKQEVVAIDIEHPRSRNFARLLSYYATETEINWWKSQQKQDEAFYLTWCAREAILKAKGRGIGAISKVRFDTVNGCFFSQDAPNGQLFFTNDLPFYLACFVEGNEKVAQCFYWQEKTASLVKQTVQFNIYQVINRES